MSVHLPTRMIGMAALLALLLSVVPPAPAWADEGTPPPDDPAAPVVDPAATALPEEGTPTAEPAVPMDPTAEIPAVEPPAPDPALVPPQEDLAAPPGETPGAAVSDPADETALPELLANAPEGTTIAVVDAAGEPVPLISDEATHILLTGDPIWCPASVKAPVWDASDIGLNGCHDRKASLQEVFAELAGNQPTVDGIIWIQGGVDSSASLVLDGSTLSTMSLYRLTLRGGWDGVSGSKAVDTHSPSIFHTPLGIGGWQNDLTLTDIEISGASAGQILQIGTARNLTLTRVNVHNNTGTGAYLDTHSGGGTGNVSISASQFSGNSSNGLDVYAGGAITLADITASGNGNYGARVMNAYSGVTAGISLTGASTFEDNGYRGLEAMTYGAIFASDLTAYQNGAEGVYLDNHSGVADPSSPGVKLTGTNIFTDNGWSGLIVQSNGAIALNSIYANANTNEGVYAYNQGTMSPMPVTLTGTSQMKYNSSIGLRIAARGKITVNNVTASGNHNIGAQLANACVPCSSDVILTGANSFHDNTGTGLNVSSYGAIAAANLSADRNGGYGANLDNHDAASARPVTLTGSNVFRNNSQINLFISTRGAILASNVTASGSLTGTGAVLANFEATTPQKVTLSGTNLFEDNAIGGLSVESVGAISVSFVRALRNGALSGNGIYLYNVDADASQPVTLAGSTLASDNYNAGLWIESKGNISITNLTASGNEHAWGAYLRNDTGAGSVTLSGTSAFLANYNTGLSIGSSGVVKLSNLTATSTLHGGGVEVINTIPGPAAPKDITLSGTHTFNSNYGFGLRIVTYGAITLSSLSASYNGVISGDGSGLSLSNSAGTIAKPVTLAGTYSLIGNDDRGLSVVSAGAIKIKDLTANENGTYGAYLSNLAASPQPVTLTGASSFLDNGDSGLWLMSRGVITAANVTATGNGFRGAEVYNDFDGATKVVLSGANVFSENANTGLSIESQGAVTLSNLTASGNPGGGAWISNNRPTPTSTSPAVTLGGTNIFNDNAYGLYIVSYGAITANAVTATGNGENGLYLDNHGASVPKAVKLTGTNTLNDNAYQGLYVVSRGAITASNLTASANHQLGAQLDNSSLDAVGGVTLSGVNSLSDNILGGLSISTRGPISLNTVSASGNGNDGAILHNDLALTPQPVKLSGTNAFSGNGGLGLEVHTLGAITISSLSASRNSGGDGASLASYQAGAITLSGVNAFSDNAGYGLYAYGTGGITINSVTASGNTAHGVYLQNTASAAFDPVKLTGTNVFQDNLGTGLFLASGGAVSTTNISALNNGSAGAYLDNSAGTGGITFAGINRFSGNGTLGLDLRSTGAVSLTQVTADDNGTRGLSLAGAPASVTITCGSVTHNGTFGIYTDSTGVLKLIGVVATGNLSADLNPSESSWIITRACPLS